MKPVLTVASCVFGVISLAFGVFAAVDAPQQQSRVCLVAAPALHQKLLDSELHHVGQKSEPQQKVIHGRGRVAPTKEKMDAMRAADRLAHGHVMKSLPKTTAAIYDCRTLGQVPPIVNQGQCGSCWDFSGTGMCCSALIKSGICKADGSLVLSEQYTLDCYSNGGCNGDDNTTVLEHAKSHGLPSTQDYGPYKGRSGSCKTVSTYYKIVDWGFCDGGSGSGVTSAQQIKDSMVAYGPIGCAVAAGGGWWDSGTGTDTGRNTGIDHDVILVGWDDNHDNGDGSKGAWIMRNSWDVTWGSNCANALNPNPKEAGYGWMKYGADEIGTEAVWCVGPQPIGGAPVVSSGLTATGTVGQPFSYQIVASNNPTQYGAAGLPAGLTVNVTTGFVSGTPTTAGTSSVTISATNSSGTGTATLTLTVGAIPPPPGGVPVITSSTTASAVVGQPFTYLIVATNSPVLFGAVGLPAGLTFNKDTGVISGTPTTAGVSAVVLGALNASGGGSAVLTLTVSLTPINPVTVNLTPDQIQSVLDQAGALVITRDVRIGELIDRCNKAGVKTPTTSAQSGDVEKRLQTLERAVDAILKALVGDKKESPEPPLKKETSLWPAPDLTDGLVGMTCATRLTVYSTGRSWPWHGMAC